MALSEILRHVYFNASDEVIRKGKKIFHTGGVHLVEHDPLIESATFRVRNDSYYNHYRVRVEHYGPGGKRLAVRCQCPYNMGTICKHEAAALFQLNDMVESGFFENVQLSYDQRNTTARMRQITHHFLKLFSGKDIYQQAQTLLKNKQSILIEEAEKDTVSAIITDEKGKRFPVVLKQNEERYFDTSCTCKETKYPLCVHKVALFLRLYDKGGANYFTTIRDWDAQKNKLLALYGYSLEDDLNGKFDFAFHEGKLFMRVLNPSIKKIALDAEKETTVQTEKRPNPSESTAANYGLVLDNNGSFFPFLSFKLVAGETDKDKRGFHGKLTEIDAKKFIPSIGLSALEKELITMVRKLDAVDELERFIKRNSPFGEYLDSLPEKLSKGRPSPEILDQVWDYYLPRYQNLLKQFQEYPLLYFKTQAGKLDLDNLTKIRFSEIGFNISLLAQRDETSGAIRLKRSFLAGEDSHTFQQVEIINEALIKIGQTIHAAESTTVVQLMESFGKEEERQIAAADWPNYLEHELLPLAGSITLNLDESLKQELPAIEPSLGLELKETENFFVLKPLFYYEQVQREWLDNRQVVQSNGGILEIRERDIAAEQSFLNVLRYLHPEIRESRKSASFLLPIGEVLKGNWYFHFLEKMQELHVNIVNDVQINRMKISPNKPKTSLQITTGIDWFDATLNLSFGEEQVSIADVKKALSKKQNFVSLKDGSIGLLSEEWTDKYGLMVKMGAVNGNTVLRINKIHFSVLEDLEGEIETESVRQQLAERREKILSFDFENPESIAVPDNFKTELRPYQKAGIQWMHFLNETGWGGILADDMGLGKTVQTLAYLQYYINNHPNAKTLVVCPTTLIYNWENETRKFTPDISFSIHHGSDRCKKADELLQGNQLIITTYGTLRSDISMFSKIHFDYVVMDESQAIKNPSSLVSKASMLLQSKNRLALSGTPVQNNTFDLFSQMEFLNPGMLGSVEFFRNEFAVPIDKMQEKDPRENLKKLIRPFLLRRTKEQVAPELPEKTETILFCEMGAKQKRIYNAYRNSFRTKILQEIDEKGMANAQFSVLTGLMKLRQICDSPAILKDETFENHSIKIQELVRELSENTTNHKALVFSQFLGMLALVKEELEKLGIPYVYFDGSTSSKEREVAIQNFQQDETCRVFLISLKAGGVGLNLTAADYVYIVDPWWNPTVEQQAIDRTHRIGQTKKIFAYRLICKETIEEKILSLQERKLNLAKDLIADENTFVKKLTREDVAYLLS